MARIKGTTGNDKLNGTNGDDKIFADFGNDIVYGKGGNDKIYGDFGNDRLYGGAGKDFLDGDFGNDRLYGGAGSDVLDGGAGNDRLIGGKGADIFKFEYADGRDVIEDFKVGSDHIKIGDGVEFRDLLIETNGRGDAVISWAIGATDQVTLKGVSPDQLSADDFIFTK